MGVEADTYVAPDRESQVELCQGVPDPHVLQEEVPHHRGQIWLVFLEKEKEEKKCWIKD